jgi:hypothetical protein
MTPKVELGQSINESLRAVLVLAVVGLDAGLVPFGKTLRDPVTPKRHFAARPPHRAQTSTNRRHLRHRKPANTFAPTAYAGSRAGAPHAVVGVKGNHH